MGHIKFLPFPSALGWMAIVWSDELLQALTFGHPSSVEVDAALSSYFQGTPATGAVEAEHTANEPIIKELVGRLQAYAEGQPDEFLDVPLALHGLTDFQRRVLHHCRRIGWGETRTYAQLAAQAGASGAARAVGNCMARNRLPLLIPCHRVVGSAGALGGYSAPDGLRMKRRLLEREGSWPAAVGEAVAKK